MLFWLFQTSCISPPPCTSHHRWSQRILNRLHAPYVCILFPIFFLGTPGAIFAKDRPEGSEIDEVLLIFDDEPFCKQHSTFLQKCVGCVHACVKARMPYICTHTHTHKFIYTQKHTYVDVYIWYAHSYMYPYIHAYICAHREIEKEREK